MTLRFEEAKAENNFCIKEKIRAINSVWNQSLSLSLSLQKLQSTHRRSAFWESTINRFPCCCARLSCWMCAFCTGSLAPQEYAAGKSQSFFFSFFYLLTALLCPFAALFMRLTLVKTWTAVIWPSHHRRPSSSSSWTSSVFFGCCLFLFVVALSFAPFLVACCFSSPSKNE
jgi:hypothetical protein